MVSFFNRWRGRAKQQNARDDVRKVEADLYNDLGVAVANQVGTSQTQILIYVVMADGAADYSIRYLAPDKRHVRSLAANGEVALSIIKLQDHVDSLEPEHRWTAMEYWLDDGEVNIALPMKL